MQKYKYITLLFVVLFLVGCAKDDFITNGDLRAEKAVYGFGVGGGTTRTFINDDGYTISWSNDDKVALWAKPATGGDYVLSNTTFNTWFVTADNSQAFFTADLGNYVMPTNTYQYYVTYPTPSSVNGTTCTYTLPAVQDGMMGGGADIMVGQGEGPALAKLYDPEASTPDYVIKDGVKLQMKHLIHALRFYVPAGKWGLGDGETIERIVFTMPQNAVGTVTTDFAAESPVLSSPTNATNTISLNLKEPIGASTANAEGVINYDYACASILPGTYDGDMTVKVYSQTKAAQVTIPINSRTMSAGHITPVGLNCTNVVNRPKISFRIASNNLGEKPYKITLTSSDTSTQWKAGDDHVYEYYTGSENSTIAVGGGFDIYYDEETLSSISGKRVTVTYESKSAIVTEIIDMPSISNGASCEKGLNVPYLFFENFDNFVTDSSHWKEKENEGSWINNWSGNQWRTDGSNMGLCSYAGDYGYYNGIFIKNTFYATDVYFGRLDSPALLLKVGENVKLLIEFNVTLSDDADNGYASCIYGYSTTEDAIVGGYTPYIGSLTNGLEGAGTNPDAARAAMTRNLPSNKLGETTNSGSISYDVSISRTTDNIRLTWFTEINNNNKKRISSKWFYAYIDNIKVQIVSE